MYIFSLKTPKYYMMIIRKITPFELKFVERKRK